MEWREIDRRLELRFPVVSITGTEWSFLAALPPRFPSKASFGIYYQIKTRVTGLDLNEPHRNPDGVLIRGTHLHRPYTEMHGVDWVDPKDCPNDILAAMNLLLTSANIEPIPADWYNPPELGTNGNPSLWEAGRGRQPQ